MAEIGLRGAKALCNMSHRDRISFIAEGLPILLASARSYWSAAQVIADRPREAEVLAGFADEEAAKILILTDVIRCPRNIIGSRIGPMTVWFYNHLARLLYSEAQSWRPSDVAELQSYLDSERKAHYLEGYGEYIMPNWSVFSREGAMYADISRADDEAPSWHNPIDESADPPYMDSKALRVAEALFAIGILTPKGLNIVADVWGGTNFKESEDGSDSDRLIEATIRRCIEEQTPTEAASNEHVQLLYRSWQMPMYNLDFRLVEVSIDELRDQQEAMLRSEMAGY